MTKLVLFLVLMLPVSALGQISSSNTKILRVFGFCVGQDRQLDFISEKFPALKKDASDAKTFFSKTFGGSCEFVDGFIPGPTKLDVLPKIDAAVRKSHPKNKDAANSFIKQVRNRASGKIYSPLKEYLLAFHPKFSSEPLAEIGSGYTKSFSAKGHPKSFGLDFDITLPFSWHRKESQRNNILQIFSSSGFDDGLVTIAISVSELPLRDGRVITSKEASYFFADDAIAEFAQEDETLIESGKFSVNGQPGGFIITDTELKRFGIDLFSRTLTYILYKDGKMIFIACVANATEKDELIKRANKYRPLFARVASSITIN